MNMIVRCLESLAKGSDEEPFSLSKNREKCKGRFPKNTILFFLVIFLKD